MGISENFRNFMRMKVFAALFSPILADGLSTDCNKVRWAQYPETVGEKCPYPMRCHQDRACWLPVAECDGTYYCVQPEKRLPGWTYAQCENCGTHDGPGWYCKPISGRSSARPYYPQQ